MIDKQLNFLDGYPKGIYHVQLNATLHNERLQDYDESRFRNDLEFLTKKQENKFIQNPDEFFQRWLNGRIDEKTDLSQYADCKGFELQIPQVIIKRFDDGDTFGKIEGLVIASDFGYSEDFDESIVFAINDLSTKRVLTYHDLHCQEIKKNPIERKELKQESIYQKIRRVSIFITKSIEIIRLYLDFDQYKT